MPPRRSACPVRLRAALAALEAIVADTPDPLEAALAELARISLARRVRVPVALAA
ncbi:MAG: hypothetical protein ACRYGP_16555 [Janthinobacterium lividum]